MDVEHRGNTTTISLTQEDLAELAYGGTVEDQNSGYPFKLVTVDGLVGSNNAPSARISNVPGTSLIVHLPEGTALPWIIPRHGIEASVFREPELMYIYGKTGKVVLQSYEV